ncbi:hypothetical protein NC653_025410 [Populus alba x Populus x berolinensis]|uniref:F-box domain-containing protein n=1 Tax=Populus alba x Populus x berolinensis TaxID=444605 RepID=A0AAD6MB68_9ROSI|nr:hypothetical protein NC653_025410 [Populus alba x Populus x berolinensis]
MAKDTSEAESHPKRLGLLKDQVRSTKKKDSDRFEIVPIQNPLSFEKGFFVVIRACQLLAQKNDGIILVGIAGPSGAGKTIFTEKILNFLPSVAVISMDNYNDSSRIVDGNFDDPRLTDYDTLLKNVHDLKAGKPAEVPVYDFKSSTRTGYRTLEVPSSRIVIIEGIYALSANLRPLLDLRVSVTGGVHFDLVKRVLRDIQRAGQEPEEIIQQISETVYPMYKAFIEPDLQTAHIKIINKFNPFSGFQSPTYILKSARKVTVDQIKAVLSEDQKETTEQIYDIYLLPPGEDPETCQSYLRMRNKDGKYNLMFEEWVADLPFIISPRITFEVTVKLLSGLMALGYTIAAILQRSSHIFSDDRVCVKIDWLGQLNRQYVQVQGRDRLVVKFIAEQLGLEGSYTPRTYIEQIQLERLVNEVMALPDDLRTKLSLDEDLVSSPKEALLRASADRVARRLKNGKSGMSHSYSSQRDRNLSKLTGLAATSKRFDDRNLESPAALANQGAITQLSEQISSLNDRMDEFTTCIEELNSKLTIKKNSPSQQNMALQAEVCNGSAPASYFVSGLGNASLNGSRMFNSSSSSQLAKESSLMEELSGISRVQRQVVLRLDTLSNLVRDSLGERSQEVRKNRNRLIVRDGQAPLIAAMAVQMGDVEDPDMISDLPQSILESILTRLPIRDAFQLSTSYLQCCPDIDQWILFLSRSDIKELVLELGEGEWFRVPSCLFNCKKLTCLELFRCEFDPPPTFKGFLCLRSLSLHQVLVAPEAIESLISGCPLLESLALSYFDSLALNIHAPNLKYLCLEGEFTDICLENTPLLVAMSVAMYMNDETAECFEQSSKCNFIKFLGGVPRLERLAGHIYFTKYLSIGDYPGSLAITYSHLKIIELYQVSFEDMKEIRVVLRLIMNSPNLKELRISGSSTAVASVEAPNLEFWAKECPKDCTFKQLKVVKMTDMFGVPHEMEFMKFLLANSPVLETMSITPCVYVMDGRLNMLIQLVRFRRASAEAEIIFTR